MGFLLWLPVGDALRMPPLLRKTGDGRVINAQAADFAGIIHPTVDTTALVVTLHLQKCVPLGGAGRNTREVSPHSTFLR